MTSDSLGDRMKAYERVPKQTLMARTPVLMRIDGKAFHTWTVGLPRPFCNELHEAMKRTAIALCQSIQNVKLAYFQSDEISLFLDDTATLTTETWFGNDVQKMASVSASIATAAFNQAVKDLDFPEEFKSKLAMFDSRVWNVPSTTEVVNYFIWRQQDASRNSVQMLARSLFSHKELHGLNNSQLQDKMMLEKNVNWNSIETWKRRGTCIKRYTFEREGAVRSEWRADEEIPIFTADREYVLHTDGE